MAPTALDDRHQARGLLCPRERAGPSPWPILPSPRQPSGSAAIAQGGVRQRRPGAHDAPPAMRGGLKTAESAI